MLQARGEYFYGNAWVCWVGEDGRAGGEATARRGAYGNWLQSHEIESAMVARRRNALGRNAAPGDGNSRYHLQYGHEYRRVPRDTEWAKRHPGRIRVGKSVCRYEYYQHRGQQGG